MEWISKHFMNLKQNQNNFSSTSYNMCNEAGNAARNLQLPHSCRCMELAAQQPFLLQETVWLSKITVFFSSCMLFQNDSAKCHCIWSKSKSFLSAWPKEQKLKILTEYSGFTPPPKPQLSTHLVKGTSISTNKCIFLQSRFQRLDRTFGSFSIL